MILSKLLAIPTAFAATCPAGQTCLIVPIPGLGASVTDPVQYIIGIYNFAVSIGGIIAMFLIILAGIERAASAGNPSKIADANDRIKNALWGLGLLFGAFIILNTINPSLTNLRLPGLPALPQFNTKISDIGKLYESQKQLANQAGAAVGQLGKLQSDALKELGVAQASGDAIAVAQAQVRIAELDVLGAEAAIKEFKASIAYNNTICSNFDVMVKAGTISSNLDRNAYCNAAIAADKSLKDAEKRLIQFKQELFNAQGRLGTLQA